MLFAATWTEWDSQGCSTSCGEGFESFNRSCVGAGECTGENRKIEPCRNLPACGKSSVSIFHTARCWFAYYNINSVLHLVLLFL